MKIFLSDLCIGECMIVVGIGKASTERLFRENVEVAVSIRSVRSGWSRTSCLAIFLRCWARSS